MDVAIRNLSLLHHQAIVVAGYQPFVLIELKDGMLTDIYFMLSHVLIEIVQAVDGTPGKGNDLYLSVLTGHETVHRLP